MGEARRGAMRVFFARLYSYAPRSTAAALGLLLLQGATEGVGLLLLVPFLGLVGGEPAGDFGGVVGRLASAFESVGLPLTLPIVLTTFVGLILIRSVLVWRSELLLTEVQVGYVDYLRGRLFAAIGNANWQHLVRSRMADATHGIGQDIFRVGNGVRAALDLVAAILLATAYGAVALILSPATTATALVIGVFLELVRIPILLRARELGEAVTEVNRSAFAVVTEFMQGLKLIKARGLEQVQGAKFVAAMAAIRERRLRFARSQQRAHLLHQVALAAALAVLIYIATSFEVRTAELLVLVFVFAKLMPMVSRVHQQARAMISALPAHVAATEMFEDFERNAEAPAAAERGRLALTQSIRIEQLRFCYDGETRAALEGLELELPARETVAVVGPSGAGKTTLVDLILGLLVPQSGSVRVDGIPLTGARIQDWRRGVAYLPQDTFLLHDTIRANLQWMTPGASEQELWDALRLCAAQEFVERLPLGLDTVVGDRGAKLSGGERQRIALARALLCDPQLLVLDEATSQIDAETEREIGRTLDELHGRLTILIVAHRGAILDCADRLFLLDGGRLRDAGTRAEVLERRDGPLHHWLHGRGAGTQRIQRVPPGGS